MQCATRCAGPEKVVREAVHGGKAAVPHDKTLVRVEHCQPVAEVLERGLEPHVLLYETSLLLTELVGLRGESRAKLLFMRLSTLALIFPLEIIKRKRYVLRDAREQGLDLLVLCARLADEEH